MGSPHWLRAGRIAGTLEPFLIKRFSDQIERIGGDGRFLLFTGGVAYADIKSGQQQRDTQHCAARIGGQSARTDGIEQTEQISKERLRPHGRVFGRGEGVEQYGMGRRKGTCGCGGQQSGKIAEVKFPGYRALSVGKSDAVVMDEISDGAFVIDEVTEVGGVFQCKLERGNGMVETDDAEETGCRAGSPQDRQNICRRPQPNIPDHEFAAVRGHPFRQAQLFDIQSLGFRHGTDDGMERLAFSERMDAVDAAGEFDNFVAGD